MTIGYYMDHHVPAAITEELWLRGVTVVTADEDGRAETPDDLLLERARQLGRVLFSQDRDLLEIAYEWMRIGRTFAGLVYAHQLKVSIGQAIADLHLIAEIAELADMESRVYRLPL